MFEIESLLISLLGSYSVQNREKMFFCPFCHHRKKKLAVNIDKRKWKCWVCGARGKTLLSLLSKLDVPRDQIRELARLLGDELPTYKADTEVVHMLTLPPEYTPLAGPSKTLKFDHAKQYLYKRGLTDVDILKYQIGFCEDGKYEGRVIVPSFDANGKLNYFVGRDIYGKSINYLAPPISKNLIGFELFINWNLPIILVEGSFDAIAVKRNCIPLFGKHVPTKLKEKIIEKHVQDIYVALDADALSDSIYILKYFVEQGRNVRFVPLTGDPSKMGFEQMANLIKNAKQVTFKDLLELKMRLVKC